MKILVGIPSAKYFQPKTLAALGKIEPPTDCSISTFYLPGAGLWQGRCGIAEEFLKDPANDYLFFCDDDMVPPPHTLRSMVARDADVVAALCCRREPPYSPVIFTGYDAQKGTTTTPEFFPTAGTHAIFASGLACSLIKRYVLETLVRKHGKHPFFHVTTGTGDILSEDLSFFVRVNEAGFKVVLDADVHVGHISDYPVYPLDALRLHRWSSSTFRTIYEKDQEIEKLKKEVERFRSTITTAEPAPV